MAMGHSPVHWTNKECRLSVWAVSQLSFSQAPHGVGALYRGCSACFPSALKLFKNPQTTQAIPGAAIRLVVTYRKIKLEPLKQIGSSNSIIYSLHMFKRCYWAEFERMRADEQKVGFSGLVQRTLCLVTANRWHAGSGNETGRWCRLPSVQFHFIKSKKGVKIVHNSSIAK